MLPARHRKLDGHEQQRGLSGGYDCPDVNQPSVYGAAKADGNPVFENTAVLHAPKTLDGRLLEAAAARWLTIFKGAKNVDLAKELIVHLLDPANFTPMVQMGGGLVLPAYQNLWTDDIVGADPNFEVFRDIMFNPDLYYGRSHPALPNALIDAIDGAGDHQPDDGERHHRRDDRRRSCRGRARQDRANL